jgi:signal recognition particle receptor subunit beta
MSFIQDKTAGLVTTRTVVLVGFLIAPLLVYGLIGSLAVWQLGWMRWLWWLAPIVWSLTWLIARLWPALPIQEQCAPQPEYWTPRDQAAAETLRRFQTDVEQYTTDQLTDPQFYLNQAQRIALELARHYRPGTTDPISDRTLPEILAACRLVADDLEELILTSVPGSRILTVNQWRKLGETPKLVRQATNAFWATRILLNPFNLAQWGTSRVTNDKVTNNLQSELLSGLYVRFVEQLGYYLIEMNSGRLRGGADAYRSVFGDIGKSDRPKSDQLVESFGEGRNQDLIEESASTSLEAGGGAGDYRTPASDKAKASQLAQVENKPRQSTLDKESPLIKIVVMGELSVGKSTLVRALLNPEPINDSNKQQASRSPTKNVQTYELSDSKSEVEFRLIDTPGYEALASGNKLSRPVQFAVENAHSLILLLNSEAESWPADEELLRRIRESFRILQNLRPPKVIVVFSKAGASKAGPSGLQLEPDLEAVIQRARARLGDLVDDYVPHLFDGTTDPLRFGSMFWVVFNRHRSAARSSAVLAAFESSLNRGKYRILLSQAKTSGMKLISNWLKRDP